MFGTSPASVCMKLALTTAFFIPFRPAAFIPRASRGTV
nr:MAG TPA: hypothetical protein [Caudoviricetes sp.]